MARLNEGKQGIHGCVPGHGDRAHVEYSSFLILCNMLYRLLVCFLNIIYM
jgi:hypothetical protein